MSSKINPKIIRVDSTKLHLDNDNPRLPENLNEKDIFKHIKRAYNIEELAMSISANGYFEAEPLVAIPKDIKIDSNDIDKYDEYTKNKNKEYIVVEGNRRLASIIWIREDKPEGYQDTDLEQFKKLPVLFYPNREDVLAFLGVHHLAGVRKWNVYERARYIVKLKEKHKKQIDDIQKIIGDKKNSAKKSYCCYRLMRLLEDYDNNIDVRDVKDNFSFLHLATSQEPIREYIGLKKWNEIDIDNPIPDEKKPQLKFLFECLFDNISPGKKSLILESRDITNKLIFILKDKEATKVLENYRRIDDAFEMIGGEIIAIRKISSKIKAKMQTISGRISSMNLSKVSNNEDFDEFIQNIESIKTSIVNIEKIIKN